MDSAPVLDALRVEVMAHVAGQNSHHGAFVELGQTNRTFGVLSELERIESSGDDAQLLSLICMPFAATADPFEHFTEVD